MKSKKNIIITLIITLFLSFSSLTLLTADPLDSFELKWQTTTGLNGYVGPISFDINDDGIKELFIAGRSNNEQGYLGREGRILCINGQTGSIIWDHNFQTSYVDYYVPMAIGDLNNDGSLELVFVNNTYTTALNAEDGSKFWNVPINSGWHQIVIADVDGTALPYVYVTDHSASNRDAKISKIRGYDGALMAQTSVGYSCYGGVSAADVDGRGTYVFAVSDGYSAGARFYDKDLNLIFNDGSVRCASNAVSFVDIDGDTLLEAIALRQGGQTSGGIYVWRWNQNQHTYERYPGKYGYNLGLGCHEQPVVGDFNNDGNYHLITAYGTVPQIWDLTNWNLVGKLDDAGKCSKAPDVANVMGDQTYEIIAHTWSYGVRIFDTDYNLIETLGFWAHYSIVDDVDDDNYNELILNGNNTIRAYETQAQAPTQEIRGDNCWYGERRTRVAEQYPTIGSIFGSSTNHPPYTPSNFNPSNSATNVNVNSQLSWSGGDPDSSDTITYDVYFGTNSQPSKVSSNQPGTTYQPGTLNYDTTYYWKIVSKDNHGATTTGPTISFTTIQEIIPLTVDAKGPYSGEVNDWIQFSGSGTGGSSPYTWEWTFGDGTKSFEQNPTHQYSSSGEYTVSLTVTDSNSETVSDTTTAIITQENLPVCDAGGPYSGQVNNLVQFSGSVTGGNSPYTWEWDFGDGSTGSGQNPLHQYSSTGSYTVTLTVTDAADNTDTDSTTINVLEQNSWWHTDWSYRRSILIDHSMIASDLVDFPLSVRLQDSHLANYAQEDGDDVVFVDGNGVKLSHEIESFDGSTGLLVAWVNVPFVSSSADTSLYMYYGNANCMNQEDVSGTWNDGFRAIHHLNENWNTETSHFKDSTDYHHHGTLTDTDADSSSEVGMIGYGFRFNGDADLIDLGVIDFDYPISYSAWMKSDDIDSNACALGRYWTGYYLGSWNWESGLLRHKLHVEGDGYIHDVSDVSSDVWYHLAVTYDGSFARYYVNGDLVGSESISGVLSKSEWPWHIGDNGNGNLFFDGVVDEVRIAKSCFSSDWYALYYESVANPNSVYSIGGIETKSMPWWHTDWSYRRSILIDHSMIASDLVDFPLSVRLQDSHLANYAQEDGDDVVFVDGNGVKLSHEIEFFDGSTGLLVAWVNVPFVSSSADTSLYMYYGNANCMNQEDVSGTWNDGFRAIHHLNEAWSTSVGHFKDSTENDNDGTLTDMDMDSSSDAGVIGNGFRFNGDADLIDLGVIDFDYPISYSAWMKSDDIDDNACALGRYWTRYYLGTWNWESGLLRQKVHVEGDSYIHDVSDVSSDVWYHLAVTYDGSFARYYVNGDLVGTKSISGTLYSTNRPWHIGDNGDGNLFFDGVVDEVRIAKSCFSSDWYALYYESVVNPNSVYSIGATET